MTTTESLAQVAQAIEEAKANLNKALAELDQLPAFDASTVGFVAHAMNNYLTITDATVSLLSHELRGYQNRDVGVWLDGLRHTAALMHHTIGRLLRASTPSQFPLKPDHVNVQVLMQRACEYYTRMSERKQLKISCAAVGDVPPAWADRVAVAVVADNLLSNAVKFSRIGRPCDRRTPYKCAGQSRLGPDRHPRSRRRWNAAEIAAARTRSCRDLDRERCKPRRRDRP